MYSSTEVRRTIEFVSFRMATSGAMACFLQVPYTGWTRNDLKIACYRHSRPR